MEILRAIGIIGVLVAGILAVFCAMLSFIVFYRWRRGNTVKFGAAGYSCIALSLGIFNLTSWLLEERDMRLYASVAGVLFLCGGLFLHLLYLLDIYRIMRPIGLNIHVFGHVFRW